MLRGRRTLIQSALDASYYHKPQKHVNWDLFIYRILNYDQKLVLKQTQLLPLTYFAKHCKKWIQTLTFLTLMILISSFRLEKFKLPDKHSTKKLIKTGKAQNFSFDLKIQIKMSKMWILENFSFLRSWTWVSDKLDQSVRWINVLSPRRPKPRFSEILKTNA